MFWRLKYFISVHRRQILTGLAAVLVVGGFLAYRLTRPKPAPVVKKTPAKPAAPVKTTKPSPLTGIELEPAIADRPVQAVVIENHTDARPQSSLSQAGVVYEALAEGGITRFMALYLDETPPVIGPVRSLRTYFVDWALEHNAPIAHAGGNADALDLIRPTKLRSQNQFNNGAYFYRTNDRFAPHNLYTTSDLLFKLRERDGYNHPATFSPYPRKNDGPIPSALHTNININYSYSAYQVNFRWEQSTNSYLRFLGGAPHIDRNNNQQLRAKNVVVIYMPTSFGTTRIGEQTVIMQTVGRGNAVVFRDGGAIEGSWAKGGRTERMRIVDSTGQDIALNRGNTWICVVPVGKTASY